MKTYLFILSIIMFVSCNHTPTQSEILVLDYVEDTSEIIPATEKDFVTISGKILNNISDSFVIKTYPSKAFSKTILIASDGSFKDTLHVPKTATYRFNYGEKSDNVFLKNGFDLNLEFDGSSFSKSLSYSGPGAVENNFLVKRALLQNDLYKNVDLLSLNPESLNKRIKEIEGKMNTFYDLQKEKIDRSLLLNWRKSLAPSLERVKKNINHQIAILNVLPQGMKSPAFKNYEKLDGSTTSLTDFKGKFVYIDVWATWCVPCIAEIPDLQILEEKYHGKNIEFISMSVDKQRDKQKWRDFVKNKNLSGIQLFVPDDFNSEFIKEYVINAIPRFILIDPEGKIVSPHALRPSDPGIIEYFDDLGI